MNIFEHIGIQQWRLRSAENRHHSDDDKAPRLDTAPQLGAEQPLDKAAQFHVSENRVGEQEVVQQVAQNSPLVADDLKSEARVQVGAQRVQPSTSDESSHESPLVPELAPTSADPFSNLDWQSMQAHIETDKHCPSCGPARSMLGSGKQHAKLMFVTDAPSASDLQQAQIFTGRAGQLFDSMLAAIGLQRGDVYATSVFKCKPFEDLTVSPACNKLLHRHIDLVCPDVIVTFGEFSAQTVLKANESLTVLRQEEQRCVSTKVAIVPTYGPAQMLDDNGLKALVWADLQRCMTLLNKAG